MTDGGKMTDTIQRWSPTLIIGAGVLTAITAALSAIMHYTDITLVVTGLHLAPFAFLLLFVGSLGLYPQLAKRTPRLAQASAVFAVLGAALAPWAGVAAIAALAGLLSGGVPTAVLGTHLLGRHAGQVALILFSVSVFRTNAYSRRVGVLLLGPAAVMLVALFHIATGAPGWVTPPTVAANAIAMLALGYTLRSERAPTSPSPSPAEPATGG